MESVKGELGDASAVGNGCGRGKSGVCGSGGGGAGICVCVRSEAVGCIQ
jgi:hypothetical protein